MESFKDLLSVRNQVLQWNEITTHLRDNVVWVAVVAPCSDDQVDTVLDHNSCRLV